MATSAYDLVPVSFDGHNINDGTTYTAGLLSGAEWGLPGVDVNTMEPLGNWPQLTGISRPTKSIFLLVRIVASDVRTNRDQLLRWFDPEDETAKKFIVENLDGSEDRYVYAICKSCVPFHQGDTPSRKAFVITLVKDGDVRWRIDPAAWDTWNITATGQTRVINNGGSDEAYPTFKIKPTGGMASDWAYKVWCPVIWKLGSSQADYPILIVANAGWDTATLVTASKMQADMDDLRVWVDGAEELNRWIGNPNAANTKVWINLNWQTEQYTQINGALGAGALTEILVDSVVGFPTSGILYIDTEAFTYTGTDVGNCKFTGVTRAAKETTAAGHLDNAVVYWIQHDVWILYGNAAAAAPATDDDYQPSFVLGTSTNDSWVYANFGESDGLRTADWGTELISGSNISFTSADHGGSASPYSDIGMKAPIGLVTYAGAGRWKISNACGITHANFTNGEKRAEQPAQANWHGYVKSSTNGSAWTQEYSIPIPTNGSTWEAWSRNETMTASSIWVSVELHMTYNASFYSNDNLEVSDCTLTLNSSNTPDGATGSESVNYGLECTITNETTGVAISLAFVMALDEELEINTDEKTVVYLKDDTRQMAALTLDGGVRRRWLSLAIGDNTIRYDETDLTTVTLYTQFHERYY